MIQEDSKYIYGSGKSFVFESDFLKESSIFRFELHWRLILGSPINWQQINTSLAESLVPNRASLTFCEGNPTDIRWFPLTTDQYFESFFMSLRPKAVLFDI